MGFFNKVKQALVKTKQALNTDVRDLFKAEGRLVDDEFLDDLLEILVKTDMGVRPAQVVVDDIGDEFRARKVQMDEVLQRIQAKLTELMDQPDEPIQMADSGPTVIMVAGVNGAGKTTSIAKLANIFRSEGKKVVLGAADTFRAAAVEQLTIWSERLGVDLVRGEQGSDPASVAHRAVAQAIETGADICIIDTAGRLQTQTNLMNELGKIRRVIQKLIPEAPHEALLVLDATTGQNGISQASNFTEAIDCTGIVLAKLDGTAKGGVVVAIRQQVGLPVKYIGLGEKGRRHGPLRARRVRSCVVRRSPLARRVAPPPSSRAKCIYCAKFSGANGLLRLLFLPAQKCLGDLSEIVEISLSLISASQSRPNRYGLPSIAKNRRSPVLFLGALPSICLFY